MTFYLHELIENWRYKMIYIDFSFWYIFVKINCNHYCNEINNWRGDTKSIEF